MRDTTIFYRSFYEAIKELPLENQALIYDAIFSYALDFTEKDLTGICKTVFTLIKPQIDANNKRFENGTKPKTKQKISKIEAKDKQDLSKTEANNNNNNNKKVNNNNNTNENDIVSRKLKFSQTLEPFLPKYGKDMLNDFYKYWVEPNKSNTKFRQELEKVWDLERRLETWNKRQKIETPTEPTLKRKTL